MSDELALFADDDGLAVLGDPEVVQAFLDANGLESREFSLGRLSAKLGAAAGAAESASVAAANSGRWLKLTKESAAKVKEFDLTETGTKGVKHAMIGARGSVKSWLQVETRAVSQLTNPALLSGAAGIMSQMAMQQAMSEIGDYLERIDEKLDDLLQAQKSAALAPLQGTALDIEEAMAIREARGRVDDITWSKLQGRSSSLSDVQGHALKQLDALATKLERRSGLRDLAAASAEVRGEIQEWLAVLARAVQLRDALGVIELDRVLDASPEELDRHRLGLQAARRVRLQSIAEATQSALARLDAAAQTANAKVLVHPAKAPAIATNCSEAATAVVHLNLALGIGEDAEAPHTRRWTQAVRESGGKAVVTGAKGVDIAKRAGGGTAKGAKRAAGRAKGAGAKAGEPARAIRRR